jgi:glutamate-ammonia-ligase adenylyltransferase
MCLRHGWQEANTLRALERLRGSDNVTDRNADQLIASYRKIRRIEGILRRWSFVGETVLPDDPAPLHRVALRCGFEGTDSFMKALGASRQALRQVYEKVFDTRPKPERSRKK